MRGEGATVSADRLVLALIAGAGETDSKAMQNKALAAIYYSNYYSTYAKDIAARIVRDVDATEQSLQTAMSMVDSL